MDWNWYFQDLTAAQQPGSASFTGWSTSQQIPAQTAVPQAADLGWHWLSWNFRFKDRRGTVLNKQTLNAPVAIFFDKNGDYDGDGEPNWYEYWKDGGAVPGLAQFQYIATLPGVESGFFGVYDRDNDRLYVGPLAADACDPVTILGSGETFGDGAAGVDCTAQTVTHEAFHKWVEDQWKPGGAWDGLIDADGDRLPNIIELLVGTDPLLSDTYNVYGTFTSGSVNPSDFYYKYGDQEYLAYKKEKGAKGVHGNDWAKPGKQTLPQW